MPAFSVVAYVRAVQRMSSAEMPVTFSASSGVYRRTVSRTFSQSSVEPSMKS